MVLLFALVALLVAHTVAAQDLPPINLKYASYALTNDGKVLEYYGVPTARSVVARTVEEAQAAAEEMGYPVAIKVIAEQISHKSDVGGVQLNLYNTEAVAEAFENMMARMAATVVAYSSEVARLWCSARSFFRSYNSSPSGQQA